MDNDLCENMDESIAFFTNLVGLKALKRFPAGPGVEIAFMGNGVDNETLVELLADSKNSSVNFGEAISIGFAVDSVDEMLSIIKIKSIPVHSGPFETPSFKFFCIKDPNGLNVQFFQQNNVLIIMHLYGISKIKPAINLLQLTDHFYDLTA